MELITRTSAHKNTTSMLLDSFMNGFINQLFLEKWYLYGRRYVHVPACACTWTCTCA